MMLDKKQIQAVFFFEFKIGHKTVETMRNINNAFGPGTANKCAVPWWFKEFCKADESLEHEQRSGWPLQVGNDQLRATTKLILPQLRECRAVLVTHSCPTLCDPVDCSPPGSSAHGDSPGKNTGVVCHALLQGIFPTQGSNSGLLHSRRILHHLSHQGRPTTWEKLPKNSTSTILCSFGIWNKLKRWKKLSKWVPHKLRQKKKKKSSFWSVIFSYSMLQKWTLSRSDCDMKWKVDFI